MFKTNNQQRYIYGFLVLLIVIGCIKALNIIFGNNPVSETTLVYVQATTDEKEFEALSEQQVDGLTDVVNRLCVASYAIKKNNEAVSPLIHQKELAPVSVVEGDYYLAGEFKYNTADNSVRNVIYAAPEVIPQEQVASSIPAARYEVPASTGVSADEKIQRVFVSSSNTQGMCFIHGLGPEEKRETLAPNFFTPENGSYVTTQECNDYIKKTQVLAAFTREQVFYSNATIKKPSNLSCNDAYWMDNFVSFSQVDLDKTKLVAEATKEHAKFYELFFGNNPPVLGTGASQNNLLINAAMGSVIANNPLAQATNSNASQLLCDASTQSNGLAAGQGAVSSKVGQGQSALGAVHNVFLPGGQATSGASQNTADFSRLFAGAFVNDGGQSFAGNTFPFAAHSSNPMVLYNNQLVASKTPELTATAGRVFLSPDCTPTPEDLRRLEEQVSEKLAKDLQAILDSKPHVNVTIEQAPNNAYKICVDGLPIGLSFIIPTQPQQESFRDYSMRIEREYYWLMKFGYLDFIALVLGQDLYVHLAKSNLANPNCQQYLNELAQCLEKIRQNPEIIAQLMAKYDCYQYPGFIGLLKQFPTEYLNTITALEQYLPHAKNGDFESVGRFKRIPKHPALWWMPFPFNRLLGKVIYDHRDVYPLRDFIREEASRLADIEEAKLRKEIDELTRRLQPNIEARERALAKIAQANAILPAENVLHDDDDYDGGGDSTPPEKPRHRIPREEVVLNNLAEVLTSAIVNDQCADVARQGLEWVELARAANKAGDTATFSRFYKRAEALLETLRDDTAKSKSYTLEASVNEFLRKNNLPRATFEQLTGTFIQQALHQEALDTLAQGTALAEVAKDAFFLSNTLGFANGMTAIAMEHIQDRNLLHASGMLDLTLTLINGCDAYVKDYGAVADMIFSEAQFILDVAARAGGILKNRIPALIKGIPVQIGFGVAIGSALAYFSGPLAPYAWAKLLIGGGVLATQLGIYLYKYHELRKKNPLEADAQLAADLIELAATGGVVGFVARHGKVYLELMKKSGQHIQNNLGMEVALEGLGIAGMPGVEISAAVNAAAGQVLPAVTKVVLGGGSAAGAAITNVMFKEAKKIIKKYNKLHKRNPKRAQRFLRSLQVHLQKMQEPGAQNNPYFLYFKQDMKGLKSHLNDTHIFYFEFNKRGKITGYHSKLMGPNSNYQFDGHLLPPNKFGVYKDWYKFNNQRKPCSFFPDHWDKQAILKAINQAIQFENRAYPCKSGLGFIGQTPDGLYIQFWYAKDAQGNWFINSVYPYVEETLSAILQAYPDL